MKLVVVLNKINVLLTTFKKSVLVYSRTIEVDESK
jgi:hypothetical protein